MARRATTGRDDVLVAVYLAEHQRLVRLAALLLGDPAAAEDLASEAFVRLDRRQRHVEPGAEGAYLRSAVLNLCRSSLRRQVLARRHAPGPPAAAPAADQRMLANAERDRVLTALQRLPMRQRQALVLRFYEELTEAETAAAMGCAVGTVKATVAKAKAALAIHLADPATPDDDHAPAAPAANQLRGAR